MWIFVCLGVSGENYKLPLGSEKRDKPFLRCCSATCDSTSSQTCLNILSLDSFLCSFIFYFGTFFPQHVFNLEYSHQSNLLMHETAPCFWCFSVLTYINMMYSHIKLIISNFRLINSVKRNDKIKNLICLYFVRLFHGLEAVDEHYCYFVFFVIDFDCFCRILELKCLTFHLQVLQNNCLALSALVQTTVVQLLYC